MNLDAEFLNAGDECYRYAGSLVPSTSVAKANYL